MKNILLAIEVNNTALMNRMLDAASQMSKAFNSKCWLIQIAAPDPDFVGYEEVDKLNIELLILGNKNHSLLHSIFIGSVTDDLIQEAKIPILLIPGAED